MEREEGEGVRWLFIENRRGKADGGEGWGFGEVDVEGGVAGGGREMYSLMV